MRYTECIQCINDVHENSTKIVKFMYSGMGKMLMSLDGTIYIVNSKNVLFLFLETHNGGCELNDFNFINPSTLKGLYVTHLGETILWKQNKQYLQLSSVYFHSTQYNGT